jgi:Tfp pilus assembly protein PilE
VTAVRAGTTFLFAAFVTALVLAVLFGLGAIMYAAYSNQADRVDKVQAENAKLERDHHAIGEQFALQSQRLAQQNARLKAALAAMNKAYRRGFVKGRRSTTLAAPFRELAPSVQQGYVVPASVPKPLGRKPRVRRTPHGYTVRWPSVALFASDREPLTEWTSKAWPNTATNVTIGPRKVLRMVGPLGTVYAWRERNKTYAVLAMPKADDLVKPLVRVLA